MINTGATDTFIAIAPFGGSSPAYQWRINGAPVAGATNSVFITAALADNDVISCEVTSSDICVFPRTEMSSGLVIHVWPVSIQQVSGSGSNYSLVPNPNKGEFTIEGTLISAAEQHVNIAITNMLGQAIYKETVKAANGKLHEHITLGNSIANGRYLVTITSGTDHVVYHVVIDR
jgi:hypothetical protein